MRVAVVVPTIQGREDDLKRCVEAYWDTAPKAKVYIERDHSSCGAAWIAGAERATRDGFDYLHLTADDLEPHAGWLETAIETVEKDMIPAPFVYRPDGTLESAGLAGFSMNCAQQADWHPVDGTTVPFVTREMWEAIATPQFTETLSVVHYCSDLMFSVAGRKHGWDTVIRAGMAFTHYTAPAGRNYGRAGTDTQRYLEWVASA
jgi:hypothetical protein